MKYSENLSGKKAISPTGMTKQEWLSMLLTAMASSDDRAVI